MQIVTVGEVVSRADSSDAGRRLNIFELLIYAIGIALHIRPR
jgi:hypothetical protein